MKQKVGFQFMGNEYFDYRSLTLAMARNWNDAVTIVDKEQFLGYFAANDPYMYGRLELEIKRCHYLESACSMALYSLYPDDGVCIGGRFFKSLKEIADCMYQNYPTVLNSFVNFFNDKCVSHVFSAVDTSNLPESYVNFVNEIPFIEEHINTPFLYSYFMRFFHDGFKEASNDSYTVLDRFFRVVLNSDTEIMKAVHELTKNPDFLVVLARYYGLPRIYQFTLSNNYFFECVGLVNKYVTFDCKELLTEGYHIWMVDHFQYYNFDSVKAKNLYKKYSRASKDKNLLKSDSFDNLFKNTQKLYIMYQEFVKLFVSKEITTSNETYLLENAYNGTIVPVQYFTDSKIDASVDATHISSEELQKVISEEVITEAGSANEPVENDEKALKKEAKQTRNAERYEPVNFRKYMNYRLVFAILALLISAAGITLPILGILTSTPIVSDIFDYGMIGLSFVGVIISLIVIIKSAKAKKQLNLYFPKGGVLDTVSAAKQDDKKEEEFMDENGIVDLDGPISADFTAENNSSYTERKETYAELDDEEKISVRKKIFFKYELLGSILYLVIAYIAGCYTYNLLHGDMLSQVELFSKIKDTIPAYTCVIPGLVALILSFFKKLKAFGACLLFTLLGVAIMFGVAALLAFI